MDGNTGTGALSNFRCRGVRTAVILHEEQLQCFMEVWRRARASGVSLPVVDDPDYASYEALLNHVLRWARTYLVWACENLDLPRPAIETVPKDLDTDVDLNNYLHCLLEEWRNPFQAVPKKRFSDREYESPWGVLYSVDAMLEHAVLHPMRHRFQLEELLGER